MSRNSAGFDLPAKLLPENARRVGPIKSFFPTTDNEEGTLPITVLLEDGETFTNIHRIILCTGYFMTYPFLPQFHRDDLKPTEADDKILVTDGLQTHNLHKDLFYIPDYTLAFVGVPYNIATFSFFEFQAMLIANVFAGKVRMPSEKAMRDEDAARRKELGTGRQFHSMHDRQREYVASLVEWAANDGVTMEGHTAEWKVLHDAQMVKMKEFFGESGRAGRPPLQSKKEAEKKQQGWTQWGWSLITGSA